MDPARFKNRNVSWFCLPTARADPMPASKEHYRVQSRAGTDARGQVQDPALSLFCRSCSPARTRRRLLRELFERRRDSFQIDSHMTGADSRPVGWTAWFVPGTNGSSDYALALAEDTPDDHDAAQRLRQAEKLETVDRLAGGVAHDCNNLLTGILLYRDLLIAHLEPCHRVRKYAEEIRNAGMQASGLVRQLLAVARPANSEPRLLSLNEVVEGMRNLLVRLIGENIDLQFHLDPNLSLVKMDPTGLSRFCSTWC
jgi:signal transduction histidine kinase